MRKMLRTASEDLLRGLEAWLQVSMSEDERASACFVYATALSEALNIVGIQARPVAGRAMWRVGPEDSAGVHHIPELGDPQCGGGNFGYHCWVMVEDWIIDPTVRHLKRKLEMSLEFDPRKVTCLWELDLLVTHKDQVNNFIRVRDGYHVDAFYEEVPGMIDAMIAGTYQESPWSGTVALEV